MHRDPHDPTGDAPDSDPAPALFGPYRRHGRHGRHDASAPPKDAVDLVLAVLAGVALGALCYHFVDRFGRGSAPAPIDEAFRRLRSRQARFREQGEADHAFDYEDTRLIEAARLDDDAR